jgi:hypothetical protein
MALVGSGISTAHIVDQVHLAFGYDGKVRVDGGRHVLMPQVHRPSLEAFGVFALKTVLDCRRTAYPRPSHRVFALSVAIMKMP